MSNNDASYPKGFAERKLGVKPGSLDLNELARRVSLLDIDPVSVRDIGARTITHSKVYFRGEAQPQKPFFVRG